MKALGRYLLEAMKGNFEPHFIVQENQQYDNAQKVPITEELLQDMCLKGRFLLKLHITVSKQLSVTTIFLCLQEGSYAFRADSSLPISGFPRSLMTENITQNSK